MNAPLLLTSVALLTGIAARPIDRQHDDITTTQNIQSHNSNRQVYLHNPNSKITLDSHFEDGLNIEAIPHTPVDDNGSASPKLIPSDSAFSDPGLSSPYVGPQRHLTKSQALGVETENDDYDPLLTLSPMPSRPSSPAVQLSTSNDDAVSNNSRGYSAGTSHISPQLDYSPMIAVMVISSLGALVLLGLVVTAVYISQLLRLTVLRGNVWRTVTKKNKMNQRDLFTSNNKPKVPTSESKPNFIARDDLDEKDSVIFPRQTPSTLREFHFPSLLSEKSVVNSGTDQGPSVDVISLSSSPALHDLPTNNGLAISQTILAWTYDNWVTHFMFALFGWMGMMFGGPRSGAQTI
ncbi:hypothetical protein Clacol_008857 [Clathrus columnatus]|uniref:Uncharacterized protein n=1 Tax=Clathrus columnatus TaxID=1419009 RepID=A0AAV5ANW9_9AGAM|nr:hypothetical protein Clacol_008857 [Clathrus columnatus]